MTQRIWKFSLIHSMMMSLDLFTFPKRVIKPFKKFTSAHTQTQNISYMFYQVTNIQYQNNHYFVKSSKQYALIYKTLAIPYHVKKNVVFLLKNIGFQKTYLLSSLYYKTGTIRCLGLHFSDRTVRLIEIFGKN